VAAERKSQERIQITTGAAAAGILALLVDARESRVKDDKEASKTEVLLAQAGLSIDEIASLMGKKYDAIRVSLNRSKSK
jgi:DNA-directed RNA polymerase specialized sigma24 family protein